MRERVALAFLWGTTPDQLQRVTFAEYAAMTDLALQRLQAATERS